MKKVITVLSCAAVIVSDLPLTVSAEPDNKNTKLPFEVTAPATVSLSWLEGGDSPTSMNAVWSMNDSMCKWLSEASDLNTHDAVLEKLQADYGLSEVWVNAQIDWVIDDPEAGWHYTPYWDGEETTDEDGVKTWYGFGHDKDWQSRTGEWDVVECGVYPKTVNECWILRGRPIDNNPEYTEENRAAANEWFYGNDLIIGLKNQLKDGQYTLVETDPETHDQAIKIDWTEHTAYIRVRWAVTAVEEDDTRTPIFSDWSEIASYGKDSKPFVPFTKETLAAPVISGLKYYPDEFNGYPQIAVTLTVPEELSSGLTNVTARGGDIHVEWEARVPGGDWVGLQGDGTITAGECVIALQNLANHIMDKNKEAGIESSDIILENGSSIELRARYYCSQYSYLHGDYLGEFYTDYSQVLTFGSQEMSKPEEVSVVESSAEEESKTEASKAEISKTEASKAEISKTEASKAEESKKSSFPWWIIIIIVVVIIIIIIIIIILILSKRKKDDDDNNKTPPANTPVNPIVDPNNTQR